jgi:hypothetical protein
MLIRDTSIIPMGFQWILQYVFITHVSNAISTTVASLVLSELVRALHVGLTLVNMALAASSGAPRAGFKHLIQY